MSHPLHPPPERFAVCRSIPDSGSFCSQDGGRHLSTSSSDDTPIFSMSKSSMDVLASSPRQRDPAFERLDVRRSSSTSEQSCTLSTDLLLTKQNLDSHNPPSLALSERWICSSVQRWSSCSAQSRSSTPDTVIFKGPRPSSDTQEKPLDPSKLGSPPSRTASPELTPTIPSQNANEQFVENQDLSPNPHSPQFSPLQAKNISPLPPKELLCFTFPSPVSSSVSLEKFAAEDPLYAVRNSQMDASLGELLTDILPQFKNREFVLRDFMNFPPTWRPPLVTSFSDPYLGVCCRCNEHFCKNKVDFRHFCKNTIREEGTMTSHAELVDIAVQTSSPIGSWWNLKRNVSNVGSQSILGSPPGSRLNLRCPVGSHSNLVSPSSSMFVIHSDEEEGKITEEGAPWETPSNVETEQPRSCLKIHDENRELGRRSSMKQVQWDEDGMTWDVHGAAIDPEELNMAIQKHLELKCNDEEEKDVKPPKRKSSKKKRAPRPPVNLKPPVILIEGKRKEGDVREEEIGRIEEREEEEAARRGAQSPGVVQRKRSIIRPFKKPGWCGSSGNHKD